MKIELENIKVSELVAGYEDKGEEGVRGYGKRLNIRPPYQREFVYKEKQRNAVIVSVRIDNALFPGRNDRLQTVVSWQTDEPATSQIYYEEGLGAAGETKLSNKAGQEDVMNESHIVILTAFKPSTIYRIKIISRDASGNIGETSIKTILTPQSAESVLDVIIGNLEERFGFLKKLQR